MKQTEQPQMLRRVLRRHIRSDTVCLCPIKRMSSFHVMHVMYRFKMIIALILCQKTYSQNYAMYTQQNVIEENVFEGL